MPNFVDQRQPIIRGNIPYTTEPTSALLDRMTQLAVRIKGQGGEKDLRIALIECLGLCPLHPRKEGNAPESYSAGVHAFKCGLQRDEIKNLKEYHEKSWLDGYDNAALDASKTLRELAKN